MTPRGLCNLHNETCAIIKNNIIGSEVSDIERGYCATIVKEKIEDKGETILSGVSSSN